MDENLYDVIIVGAGFAGIACAHELARAGLKVCVIDRKADLGERIHTTGILVDEALREPLFDGLPAHLCRSIPHVRLYAPGLSSLRLAAPGYRFHTTDTPALMRWLGESLSRSGIELRLETPFTTATPVRDGWHLPGIGQCRYLIGADGARSRVASQCGLGGSTAFLYGVEYEFDGLALREPDALHCFISKRFAPGYIGWIAQTPTGVQAGLAQRHHGTRSPPDLRGFLASVARLTGLPDDCTPSSTRAGLIPCGGPCRPLAARNVFLVGDAAGVVSPVTAGGIHAALRHGAAVGQALARGQTSPADMQHLAARSVRGFTRKRLLRWAFDHMQWDWPFNLMLHTPLLRRCAAHLYFHRRAHTPEDNPGVAAACAGSRPDDGARLQ